ncbi:methyltransferase [Candidatus Woesearchaeota archaeon]|nr:methyltransferase [Candidatus Woesearchaeota archaeon]
MGGIGGKIGSKAGLAIILSGLGGFDEAKVRLEQYPTDGNTAADMLWNAYLLGDIKDKEVIDLGAGTGILGIGAGLLGATKAILVDKDKNALEAARRNISKLKSEGYKGLDTIEIEEKDISEYRGKGDTVIENPPFGTKIRHNDAFFLEKALESAKVVYSLHKSESKGFLEKFAAKKGAEITHIWNYRLPLKAAFDFHRRRIHRIEASCFRFELFPTRK